MERFDEEMAPYAVGLTQHLAAAFWRMQVRLRMHSLTYSHTRALETVARSLTHSLFTTLCTCSMWCCAWSLLACARFIRNVPHVLGMKDRHKAEHQHSSKALVLHVKFV